jgi:hypothetical protein
MVKSISKTGRPQAFYRTSWGERIDGLALLADGRWKISGPKTIKFSERDERLAVARYHAIMAEANKQSNLGKPKVHGTWHSAFEDALQRSIVAGDGVTTELTPPHDPSGRYLAGAMVVAQIENPQRAQVDRANDRHRTTRLAE